MLVSKQHRNVGAGRTLAYHYVRWCKKHGIRTVFHWPDGEHPEKIYYDAGFRYVETISAGRVVYYIEKAKANAAEGIPELLETADNKLPFVN